MFDSHRCSDDETCEEIAQVWSSNGYLIDPHTAIGTKAAKVCHGDSQAAMVTLATAHPAKFPAAIEASGIGVEAQLPSHLADLLSVRKHLMCFPMISPKFRLSWPVIAAPDE